MIWVGLTGGIASGKSTVSRLLRQAGAFIIDADKIAHDLIKKGEKAYHPVVEAFGKGILDGAGEIDRKRLGKIAFRDPIRLKTLNQIIHPSVLERAERKRKALARKHPKGVTVFDAALLIESGAYKGVDWVLLVYVDRATQVDRLTQRDGLSRKEAERRVDIQMPIDQKVSFADEVINNLRPFPEVEKEVNRIYKRLQDRA
ncbi:MAG: dephospho-CoA kinase [Nitrospiria bacterium]